MQKNNLQVYANITKVDEEKRMVYGYASTEALDSQGEVIKREAIERALPDYMKFGNIREMHQPSAVGKTKEATMDDKGLYIGVKVVDDSAWAKVKEGVYSAFSIGGRKLMQKGREILDMVLTEISLVDRPANPEAVFDMYKAESNGEMSDNDLRQKLYEALNAMAGHAEEYMECPYYIVEVYSDHCVAIHMEHQQPLKFPFTVAPDGTVTLGEPEPVKLVWEAAAMPKESADLVYSLAKLIHVSMGKQNAIAKDEEQKPEVAEAPETPTTPDVPATPPEAEQPAEQPAEAPVDAPAEVPAAEAPAAPAEAEEQPATEEQPAAEAVDAPLEEMAKIGAKLSKESRAAIMSALSALTALLGAEEKADQPTNLSKGAPEAPAPAFAKVATEVADLTKQVSALTERLAKYEKAEQPIKAVAGFVTHTKEGTTTQKGDDKENRQDALKKRAAELLKLRETMPIEKFTREHGDEANKVYDELQKFRAQAA